MTSIFQPDGTMVAVSVRGGRTEHGDRAAHGRARRLHRRPARHGRDARSSPSRAPGQLKDLPQRRHAARVPGRRRFGLRGRPDARRGDCSPRATGRRHRRLEGQGLRRHHQAPQLPPRPGDPRLRLASRARLDRPRHDAGQASSRARAWPATWATSASPSRRSTSSAPTPSATCCSSRAACPGARNSLILVRKAERCRRRPSSTRPARTLGSVELPDDAVRGARSTRRCSTRS